MFFFERELELYVSTVSSGFTTSNTVKLAVLEGTSIDYRSKKEDTYNYKIENLPNRTPEKVLVGYTDPVLKFSTYAKPYNDTTNDTCVEKILLESLMGNTGTEDPANYTIDFASVNKLPEIYLWLKLNNNLVYYLKNGVVKTAEYKIELDKYSEIQWEIVGRELEKTDNNALPTTYTDYSNISEFVSSKLSALNFSFDAKKLFEPDDLYLTGADYTNNGNNSSLVVAEQGNISIVNDYYDFGSSNSDTGRISITGGPSWTGDIYPNDGVGNFLFEAIATYDGTVTGTQQTLFSLLVNSNNRCYYQSGFQASWCSIQIYPGNTSDVSSYVSFSDLGIENNVPFHFAFLSVPSRRYSAMLINGIPVSTAWHFNNLGDPGSAAEGILIGNNSGTNTDPWFWGGMKEVAMTYGTTNVPRYDYTYDTSEIDNIGNATVVNIKEDLIDESNYNHSIVNNGTVDQGTYLDSPESSTTSFTVARSSAWTSTGDWSLSFRIFYDRSGGVYVAGTIFDDGVRRVRISNNQLFCEVNGSVVCRDQDLNASYYTTSFNKGVWYYVAFERKDGIYLLYMNGALRAANGKQNLTPNAVSTTGTATVLSFGSGYRAALQYLRLDNTASRTLEWKKPKYVDYEKAGLLPIVSGNVRINNDLDIVERNTLDLRLYNKLDHYVKSRNVEINITGYLKTGASKVLSTLELYDYLIDNPDFTTTIDLNTNLRIGASNKNNVNINFPKSDIDLPRINIKDVITSNIKITPKKKSVNNDDVIITYTNQDLPSDRYIPDGVFVPTTYSDFVKFDGAIGLWDMQGTPGSDSIGGYGRWVTGSWSWQQSTDSTTPGQYCAKIPNNDARDTYIRVINQSASSNVWNWQPLTQSGGAGLTIEFFFRFDDSTPAETQATIFIFGSTINGATLYLRMTGSDRFILSNGSTNSGSSWTPTVGTWYHVACVWTHNKQELYIDGNLYTTGTLTINPVDDKITIGGWVRTAGMSFSHVALYDFALGADRISYHNSIRSNGP